MDKDLIEGLAYVSSIVDVRKEGDYEVAVFETDDENCLGMFENLTGLKVDNDMFVNEVRNSIHEHNNSKDKQFNLISYLPEPWGIRILIYKNTNTNRFSLAKSKVSICFEAMTDELDLIHIYLGIYHTSIKKECISDVLTVIDLMSEWDKVCLLDEYSTKTFHDFLEERLGK